MRPLKVFLCHAYADRDPVPKGDDMHALYVRLKKDGVDIMPVGYAWLDKEKLLRKFKGWKVASCR